MDNKQAFIKDVKGVLTGLVIAQGILLISDTGKTKEEIIKSHVNGAIGSIKWGGVACLINAAIREISK